MQQGHGDVVTGVEQLAKQIQFQIMRLPYPNL